jgi:hypothetical protein
MDARKPKRIIDLDELLGGPSSDGGRAGDPGLSLQQAEPEGSVGHADLQPGRGEQPHPSLRTEGGEGASGAREQDRGGNAPRERRDVSTHRGGGSADSGRKSGASLQSLGLVVGAELPDISDGHWQAPQYPVAQVAEDGLCNEPETVNNEQTNHLNRIVNKALRKIEDILDLNPAPWDNDYARLLSIQKDAAASAINMAIKADESRFRAQSDAAIAVILDEVRRLKAGRTQAVIENHAT